MAMLSRAIQRPGSGPEANQAVPPRGRLDGLTILRFAHTFETGGGVERHLADLNRELSLRNSMTTVQMHLSLDPCRLAENETTVGSSRLVNVPLLVQRNPTAELERNLRRQAGLKKSLGRKAMNILIRTRALNALFAYAVLSRRKVPERLGEPNEAGRKAPELLRRFKVDLVVLHTSGGADASDVVRAARAAGVPILLVHHFSNNLLEGASLRQQTCQLAGIGGASLVGVPPYLRRHFYNLSDAVDLNFYQTRQARPLPRVFPAPIVYAPGRLTPEKGQMDVIRIASILRERNLPVTVVFAGRTDSPSFEKQLREAVATSGLSESVHFAGELTLEEYRDWFGAAYLTVMPTHHDEGMPRTLIDSQAMKVPPLVYDSGGTREGVKHGETGYLIRRGDVQGMADAAARLLRDPETRGQMAEAGRCFVEQQFSLQAFASRHEDFYLKALGRKPSQLARALGWIISGWGPLNDGVKSVHDLASG